MSSLKHRFEEILHMDWGEFVKLEEDKFASVDDVVLCSLVRICAVTDDIAAIKLAFDRADGLLETLIDIKVPKFYTRYVNAEAVEPSPATLTAGDEVEEDNPDDYDPATAKLRETLKKMRSMPHDVIRVVRLAAKHIDEKKFPKDQKQPSVKAVIVANLLKHVTKGRFRAIELVFDQIDGKLPKSIKLLGGEDVYVDDYTEKIAPAGSEVDDKGVYYAENKLMTAAWIRGFAQSQKGLETLAEGLNDD